MRLTRRASSKELGVMYVSASTLVGAFRSTTCGNTYVSPAV